MEQNAEISLSSAYSWKDLGLKIKIPWIIGSKRSNDKVLKQLSLSLSETPLVTSAGVQTEQVLLLPEARGLDKSPQATLL